MKKNYMKPTMKVIVMHQQHFLCESGGMNSRLQNGPVSTAW